VLEESNRRRALRSETKHRQTDARIANFSVATNVGPGTKRHNSGIFCVMTM